jgi:hypothetical protein
MTTVQRMTAVVAVGVLALVGVACGGDDTGSPELRQAVAAELQQAISLDAQQADCFAGEMIGIYGADEMQQFVDDPENYAPAEEASPESTQNALDNCGISVMQLLEENGMQGEGTDTSAPGPNAQDPETPGGSLPTTTP